MLSWSLNVFFAFRCLFKLPGVVLTCFQLSVLWNSPMHIHALLQPLHTFHTYTHMHTCCLVSPIGVFLISVKPLTAENTENKTTPKICKITVVQAIKKLTSISRAWLNFRRRPVLCTTLYRNLMQASNFGGTFDQLFLWIFFCEIFTEDASPLRLYQGAKKVKMTKNSNQGGVLP